MKKIVIPTILVAIMWLVFLIFGAKAAVWGIHPRDIHGLKGIFFAPFIHLSWAHILSNSLPILILTIVLSLFYNKIWLLVWFLVSISAGILVWFFGRNAYHAGASITIFGLLGFLMSSGIFRKRFKDIIISLVIGFFYGGALLGIVPTTPGVSWESHLFGFIVGILWAYAFRNVQNDNKSKNDNILPNTKF